MGVCEVCGNEYDKTMDVIVGGEAHVFEADNRMFCCAHCAYAAGVTEVRDRA